MLLVSYRSIHPFPEDAASYAHQRAAFRYRQAVIVRHAHGQLLELRTFRKELRFDFVEEPVQRTKFPAYLFTVVRVNFPA